MEQQSFCSVKGDGGGTGWLVGDDKTYGWAELDCFQLRPGIFASSPGIERDHRHGNTA